MTDDEYQEVEPQTDTISDVYALVAGVGGAGANVVSVIATSPCRGVRYVALDSDRLCLNRIQNCETIQLGQKALHGMGSGSNREIARSVAEAEKETLSRLVKGCFVLFLVTGLGGGIGGGVSPMLAKIAADAGVFVVALTIYPFDCEGTDRLMCARLEQDEILTQCHLVISLPNQLLTLKAEEDANYIGLYGKSNQMIARVVESLWLNLYNPSILPLDMGMLRNVFPCGKNNSVGRMAIASAAGDGRIECIWQEFLRHPWLNSGEVLRKAGRILAIFNVGDDFNAINEIDDFRGRLHSENPDVELFIGVSKDSRFQQGEISVVLIATPNRTVRVPDKKNTVPMENEITDSVEIIGDLPPRPVTKNPPPVPPLDVDQLFSDKKHGSNRWWKLGYGNPNQGVLDLQVDSLGRFDRCEKTYFEGQQLDVPTYIRLKYELR